MRIGQAMMQYDTTTEVGRCNQVTSFPQENGRFFSSRKRMMQTSARFELPACSDHQALRVEKPGGWG
jgi:hypothetical protein